MLGNGIDVGRDEVSKNLYCLCQGRILSTSTCAGARARAADAARDGGERRLRMILVVVNS
jgi:hypothetical protein